MLRIATLVLVLTGILLVDTANARKIWRFHQSHSSQSGSRLPRPVTGYGANLHRNAVLKQELRRAQAGKPVRSRGNIRWSHR